MKRLFDRIHVWLAANAPDVLASLRPGASEKAIRAAEAELGISLPDDVRACYRIHDGQNPSVCSPHWAPYFLYGAAWHSLQSILTAWRGMKGLVADGTFAHWHGWPQGPARDDWWHPAWIPLTTDHTSGTYCLDLAPAPGGTVGQILDWQNNDPRRSVVAGSFTEWLSQFADDLEAGEYATAPGFSGLIHQDDPYWS